MRINAMTASAAKGSLRRLLSQKSLDIPIYPSDVTEAVLTGGRGRRYDYGKPLRSMLSVFILARSLK